MSIEKPFPGMMTPATFEAGSEFIDREPQWAPSKQAQDFSAQGDAQRDMEKTPLGQPPIDVDVRSTYDVRPIQGFDANLPLIGTVELVNGSEVTLTTTLAAAVPLGYVFVMRKLSPYFFGAIPPIIFRNDALLTIRRNQGDVPYNVSIPVGVDVTDLETFLIYDEGEQYGARINLAATIANFEGAFFGCTFYGNFLRKTGRSAPQEIGNPVLHPMRSTVR